MANISIVPTKNFYLIRDNRLCIYDKLYQKTNYRLITLNYSFDNLLVR